MIFFCFVSLPSHPTPLDECHFVEYDEEDFVRKRVNGTWPASGAPLNLAVFIQVAGSIVCDAHSFPFWHFNFVFFLFLFSNSYHVCTTTF